MKSIIEYLGTREVPRLRVGIGSNTGAVDLSQHVLGKFRPDELTAVAQTVEQAAKAVIAALNGDLDSAMNEYNKQ